MINILFCSMHTACNASFVPSSEFEIKLLRKNYFKMELILRHNFTLLGINSNALILGSNCYTAFSVR
jgi:hypothetical protein